MSVQRRYDPGQDSLARAGYVVSPENRPSFQELYKQHLDFIWRNARRFGVEEALLDDVVQEVFLVAHRRLDSFDGRSSMRTWLIGILRNVVRHHRRSRSRKPLEFTDQIDTRSDEGRHSKHSAGRLEALEMMRLVLNQLDEGKREVFVMADLEGMTAAEIGNVLQMNPKTVASRLRLARQEVNAIVERIAKMERRELR